MTPLSFPKVRSQPAAFRTCDVTDVECLISLAAANAYAESIKLLPITTIREEATATAKTAAIDLLLNITFDDYDYVIFFKNYEEK